MKRINEMMDIDVMKLCKDTPNGKATCFNRDFLTSTCKSFPWKLLKIVRMKLELMRVFLEDPQSSDLQIIYLVRDPRAVINSRRSTVKWCKPKDEDCYSPKILCQDMEEDLKTYNELKLLYPDRVHILRYEDLMQDVHNQSKKITEAVGLQYSASMDKFVSTHTTNEVNTAWTTSRDSKARLLHWTKKLGTNNLQEIQYVCKDTMAKFGYKVVERLNNLVLEDVLGDLILEF